MHVLVCSVVFLFGMAASLIGNWEPELLADPCEVGGLPTIGCQVVDIASDGFYVDSYHLPGLCECNEMGTCLTADCIVEDSIFALIPSGGSARWYGIPMGDCLSGVPLTGAFVELHACGSASELFELYIFNNGDCSSIGCKICYYQVECGISPCAPRSCE